MKPSFETNQGPRPSAPVNRRDALASLVIGAGAALAACAPTSAPLARERDAATIGKATQALADDGILVAAAATGDPATDWANLDAFFRQIESYGLLGILPAGHYVIGATLTLPFRGRVQGSGTASALAEGATVIQVNGSFDALQLLDNQNWTGPFGGLELSHLCIRGVRGTAGAAIRLLLETSFGRRDDYFHDIVVEQTFAGIHVSPPDTHGIPTGASAAGLTFERIVLRTKGYGGVFQQIVACEFRKVYSDHANDPQDADQESDLLFEGIPGNGGIILDLVGSANASQNGVVIRNFLQVFGRHVNGDEAWIRGVWIFNCDEVYLNQCFTSLAGHGPQGLNTANGGFCCVVEGFGTLGSRQPGDPEGRVVLTSCFFGDGATNGLLVKRVRNVTVSGSLFTGSQASSLHVLESENVTVNGSLFKGVRADATGFFPPIRIESSLGVRIDDCQIDGFTEIFGQALVFVSNANNVSISNNTLQGPGSLAQGTAIAIYASGATHLSVTGNQIYGYDRGIYLSACNDAVVSANVLRGLSVGGSAHDGLTLSSCAGAAVTGNRITLYNVGIRELGSPHHNGYVGNNLSFNGAGYSLVGTNNVNQGNLI